jgi:hypothetical protein
MQQVALLVSVERRAHFPLKLIATNDSSPARCKVSQGEPEQTMLVLLHIGSRAKPVAEGRAQYQHQIPQVAQEHALVPTPQR